MDWTPQPMLRMATASLERAGSADAVQLRRAYDEAVTSPLWAGVAFDAIVSSYRLSLIPDWKQSLRAAGAALRPSGPIHVVDFGDLGSAGLLRAVLRLTLFHVEPREALLKTLEVKTESGTAWLRTPPGR